MSPFPSLSNYRREKSIMPLSTQQVSRYFAEKPRQKYACPSCKGGSLVPDQSSFKVTEPNHSKAAYDHEAWDPDWIEYRFTFKCVCDKKSCGEIAYVAGSGTVDQRYGEEDQAEYYESFCIQSFFPAPNLIHVPKGVPEDVKSLLEKSFALYWVDVSAAANALRSSLESLLDELQIPSSQKNSKGDTVRLSLHRRLRIWSDKQSDFAELCFALKEVGNLGSHGENVREKHYFGALEIYAHVLVQLYENNAEKMKALAEMIKSEIKGSKPT
jgi:hypothetical protein